MLENKTVFVTGGDKGIGLAVVTHLASLYKNVIFTYNSNLVGSEAVASVFTNVFFYQCNLKDREQIKLVASEVLFQFGRIDILINNAGYEDDATFLKMDEVQWCDVIDINLKSIFYLAHHFVPQMVGNGWGRIINFTSIAGYTGVFGKSNYAAAKAGIVGFTKSLGLELGSKGICVNAIAPGAIETDMLMRIPEKYRMRILEDIPSHRFGTTKDVANLVEFLVSEKASYINAQTIHINGGSYSI